MIFGTELAPAATAMAPGISGMGGRPKPRPLIHFTSCLIEKSSIPLKILLDNNSNDEKVYDHTSHYLEDSKTISVIPEKSKTDGLSGIKIQVPLVKLCYGRSGDKGDFANIGIIARKADYYPFLKRELTAQVTKFVFIV